MNHLSEEQISRRIAGDATAEEEEHGRECALCRSAADEFESTMSAFLESATHWAAVDGAPRNPYVPDLMTPRRARIPALGWLAVTAAAIVLTSIPLYRNAIERQREAQAARESQFDEQLLRRIDAHLSRTAPASLQPLLELTSSAADSQKEGEQR